MNGLLTKSDFEQNPGMVLEKVPTPEIKAGGFVFVRSMNAEERGFFESEIARYKETNGKTDFPRMFTRKVAAKCACDEKGERIFTDGEVTILAKSNAAVVARIAAAGQRLSGFSKQDIEDLEKNSDEAQPEDSPSV